MRLSPEQAEKRKEELWALILQHQSDLANLQKSISESQKYLFNCLQQLKELEGEDGPV